MGSVSRQAGRTRVNINWLRLGRMAFKVGVVTGPPLLGLAALTSPGDTWRLQSLSGLFFLAFLVAFALIWFSLCVELLTLD